MAVVVQHVLQAAAGAPLVGLPGNASRSAAGPHIQARQPLSLPLQRQQAVSACNEVPSLAPPGGPCHGAHPGTSTAPWPCCRYCHLTCMEAQSSLGHRHVNLPPPPASPRLAPPGEPLQPAPVPRPRRPRDRHLRGHGGHRRGAAGHHRPPPLHLLLPAGAFDSDSGRVCLDVASPLTSVRRSYISSSLQVRVGGRVGWVWPWSLTSWHLHPPPLQLLLITAGACKNGRGWVGVPIVPHVEAPQSTIHLLVATGRWW